MLRRLCVAASLGSRSMAMMVDSKYPGTAVERLNSVHGRVAKLTRAELDQE